jgi:hypothetical protein
VSDVGERGGVPLEVTARLPNVTFEPIAPQQIIKVKGRTGVFTPIAVDDATQPRSTENLLKMLDVLRRQVVQLQDENAKLRAQIASTPPRSADDVATAIQRSVDSLQSKLLEMDNPVTNFALREFSLESRVRIDVTELGTLGFHFVQPDEQVNASSLSTLSVTLAPVPKQPEPGEVIVTQPGPAIDSLPGLTPKQAATLRANHVHTARDLVTVATRASATAALTGLLGVDRRTLGRHLKLAALLTLPSVDVDRAEVLAGARLGTVAAIAAAQPDRIVDRYATAAAKLARDDGWRPSLELAAQWVATAQALEAQRPG